MRKTSARGGFAYQTLSGVPCAAGSKIDGWSTLGFRPCAADSLWIGSQEGEKARTAHNLHVAS